MKKVVSFLICVIFCLVAQAKSPNLNVEKLFDGTYNTNKNVTIQISKSKGNYFRGITVNNDPSLVKTVNALYNKDVEQAGDFQDIFSGGRRSYSSIKVTNNGMTIYIGLSFTSDNSCYLFIKGPLEAFE